MSKTNWQDPGSSEILSTHISGLQEAVGKIEDAIGLQTVAETDIPLTEVYISDTDRYRIYQAPEGKRNWVADPAPVIKKNGVVISSGFTIDYGGGAIILSPAATGSDVFTADVTRVNSTHSITPASIGAETPAGAQAKVDAAMTSHVNDSDPHPQYAMAADLNSHLAENATNAHLAKNIGIEDEDGNFTASDVEGALSELFTFVSDGKDLVGTAITDVDPNVEVPTNPTFAELVAAIGQISTGKKTASGILTSSSTTMSFQDITGGSFNAFAITVTGLAFKPTKVIVYNNSDGAARVGIDTEQTLLNGYNVGMLTAASVPLFRLSVNAYIISGEFRLPCADGNANMKWFACE